MRGLDPRIHLFARRSIFFARRWIAGSSPAMTACDIILGLKYSFGKLEA
jgi:hypothetical protein